MKTSQDALDYFVGELSRGHMSYDAESGLLSWLWRRSKGWLETPQPAGKLLKGYLILQATISGRTLTIGAHRVIYQFCMGDLTQDLTINHKNGNKTDNRIANLEAVTMKENAIHARVTGLHGGNLKGDLHPKTKIMSRDTETIKSLRHGGLRLREIASLYNVSASLIGMKCKNPHQTCKNEALRSISDRSVLKEILHAALVVGESCGSIGRRLGVSETVVACFRKGKTYTKERDELIAELRSEGHNVDMSRASQPPRPWRLKSREQQGGELSEVNQ